MAWMASVRSGFTSRRTVPLRFSSCLVLIGALDKDAHQPCCDASVAGCVHSGAAVVYICPPTHRSTRRTAVRHGEMPIMSHSWFLQVSRQDPVCQQLQSISTARTLPPSRLHHAVRRAPGVLCGTRRAAWLALSALGGRRGVGERVGAPSVEKAVRMAYTQATYTPCCFAGSHSPAPARDR
jgi:hypothetical protein